MDLESTNNDDDEPFPLQQGYEEVVDEVAEREEDESEDENLIDSDGDTDLIYEDDESD